MSSVQSRTLSLTPNNATSYISYGSGCSPNGQVISCVSTNQKADGTLNSAAKDILYPNGIAHPNRLEGSYHAYSSLGGESSTYIRLYFNGVMQATTGNMRASTSYTINYDTSDSSVLSAVKASDIHIAIASHASFIINNNTYSNSFTISLYFTRYDFSASTSTGITSVSVSSATGYDGDSITFTASIQNGYTFDGWYNGSTKVSDSQTYTYTVNGTDLSLTAKAIVSTKRLTVNYGGANVIDKQVTPPVSVTYDGTQIASLSSGQTKTLNCGNKLMTSNVIIGAGGGTLLCSGKFMATDITIAVS